MKRLIPENQNTKNTAEEYDAIFLERQKRGVDWADMRRWKMLLKYYERGEVIDMGCLDSRIINFVEKDRYIGIDISQRSIEEMRHRYGSYFLVRDIYNTCFSNSQFDYAVLGEVLEHLERPEDAVKEAFRILRPGGVLAISVPLEEAFEPGALDGDRHIWSYSKEDIEKMVEPYGTVIETKILRSKWFPKYKYCWPVLVIWVTKN